MTPLFIWLWTILMLLNLVAVGLAIWSVCVLVRLLVCSDRISRQTDWLVEREQVRLGVKKPDNP